MCGILGAINSPFDSSLLDLIRHRGPDDADIHDIEVAGHKVTLGHRRLSIVDLSPAGRQPMRTRSGKQTIVFNGEIYNHQDLRKNLDTIRFRGHSDSETILYHLAKHGVTGAADFNGIFTFGFLDEVKCALYLARDPFGVKPLYYYAKGNQFLFSSELRPLQQRLQDTIDPDSLAELLRLRYLPAPDTLFRNIHKVRPGHVIEVDLGGPRLKVREYPFAEPPSSAVSKLSRTEAVVQYGDLVKQAVERQLMSDVPIGILLSGGVDSALVADIARKKSGYRMKAFTVGFGQEHEADEIADAEQTARELGLEHYSVRLGLQDFLTALPRITSIVEEPLATTSIIPMDLLSRLASEHVKVVLSGQGADEAMGGYRRYQMELIRSWLPAATMPLFRTALAFLGARNETLGRALRSYGIKDDVNRFESVYGVFEHDEIRRLTGNNNDRARSRIQYNYDRLNSSQFQHSVERMMSIDLRMNLADDLLLYTDKITMHYSIECRVPFLDLPLVRFLESLPAAYRLGILRGKQLHRRHCAHTLPRVITRRRKKGFASPTRRWFRESQQIYDLLLEPNSNFAQYFDLREVRSILNQHRGGLNRERHIFLLLSLHSWMSETLKPATCYAAIP